MRLSNSVRPPGWISTEYNNQNLPDKVNGAGGFYTMGSQGIAQHHAKGMFE